MNYYAIRCANCGRYSSKQCKETQIIYKLTHRCSYCKKSRKLKKVGEYGLQLRVRGPFEAKDIGKIVANLNGGVKW